MAVMATRISTDDVAHVARLARLSLTPEELERFTEQLGAVLDHARDVEALDTAGVPPTAHPLPLANVLRDDVVVPCLDRDEVLVPGARRWNRTASGCPGSSGRRRDRRPERERRRGCDPRTGQPRTSPPGCGPGDSRPGRCSRITWPASTRPRARSTPSTWSPPRRPAPPLTRWTWPWPRGHDPGPLAGVPIALKDNLCTRGVTDHLLVADPRGLGAPLRRHRRPAGGRGRGGRGRQDQPRRVRHGLVDGELGLRPDPQPPRPEPGPGRVVGRERRRRGRRLRGPRPRIRHRRLDPPAGRSVRGGRRQAHLRAGLPLRADRLRQLPRPDRPAGPQRGRRRPVARRHLRPGSVRLHLAPGRPATRRQPGWTQASTGCASEWWGSWSAPRGSPSTSWLAPGKPRMPWPPPAPRSTR